MRKKYIDNLRSITVLLVVLYHLIYMFNDIAPEGVIGSAQILNMPMIAVYRFGIYGFTFLLGYYVFANEEVTDVLKKYCMVLIGAAIVLGIVFTVVNYGSNYAVEPCVNSPLAVVYGWILYEIIVRIPVVRWCVLGIKKEKK